MKRAAIATAATITLLAAGAATAGILTRTIHLRAGHCVTVSKTRVCAAGPRTLTRTVAATTVTVPVTDTVTAPADPATIVSEIEQMNVHDVMHQVLVPLVPWWNQYTGGLTGSGSTFQSGAYLSADFTCTGCG